ncbi:Uncharacterized protein dnm_041270 [Desulfonema magnum]|uniref:Uncharacterized protein n=1 Tax=Desulfonema magnum TaxID=45655 RepID=A0A975BMB0_9BACT|nr:Uncharacterized protein dnm_041270 [Desulfonema magnum]
MILLFSRWIEKSGWCLVFTHCAGMQEGLFAPLGLGNPTAANGSDLSI